MSKSPKTEISIVAAVSLLLAIPNTVAASTIDKDTQFVGQLNELHELIRSGNVGVQLSTNGAIAVERSNGAEATKIAQSWGQWSQVFNQAPKPPPS
jgi:hypothetical protein